MMPQDAPPLRQTSVSHPEWAGTIRRLRAVLGLTQERLAQHLDTTVSSVNRWENGRSIPARMTCRALMSFALAHGVTLDVRKE